MHRPVADEPRVGLQQLFVGFKHLAEMGRAGFFFAFEQAHDAAEAAVIAVISGTEVAYTIEASTLTLEIEGRALQYSGR